MKKKFINKYLGKFGVELHGKEYLQSLANGDFKKDPLLIQKERVGGDCRIIFDVGANRGDITALYRQGFPEAEIFAFEPFPESLDTFKGRHGT
ncbi:MAG TPA: hypothetical protein VG052_17550, partial [Puia sp.]|nr:hypothetical protein [Puia sp.]